jgi:hypothetical protein
MEKFQLTSLDAAGVEPRSRNQKRWVIDVRGKIALAAFRVRETVVLYGGIVYK